MIRETIDENERLIARLGQQIDLSVEKCQHKFQEELHKSTKTSDVICLNTWNSCFILLWIHLFWRVFNSF